MNPEKEDRRVKKLFTIPIESQKPNIGPVPEVTDLRTRLQNFLSEAEKAPMPENAENNKLIEFVENESTGNSSNDDSNSESEDCNNEDNQKSSNNIVVDLYIPKNIEKETSLVEEIDDV
ncbi:Hypothetical protein SRAE_2000178300 [Strongyloides ratti]|uniref:Uncharacterized protein n=1 Tax=Strongyloides ratti TaxID=34506 RepID=A0A090LG51_STRRB|nr:Hypothetical protein SRAE_2000178300 [Strongyloides ratti]CEF67118.1 Hypothetical protein SRAE_2000178300 [Strongyloides ratti]